jgi:hypothetical protein
MAIRADRNTLIGVLVAGPDIQIQCQPGRGNTQNSIVFVYDTSACTSLHGNIIAMSLSKLHHVLVYSDSGTSRVGKSSACLHPSDLLRRFAEE